MEKEKKPYGFCQKCGHPFNEADIFCEECGNDLSKIKESLEKKNKKREETILVQETKPNDNQNLKKGILLLIIVAVIIGGSFLVKQYIKKKDSIDSTWGETYYVYLKEVKEKEETENLESVEEANLSFYEIEGLKEPIMVLSYEKDGKTYSYIYYVKNGKVNALNYQESMTVELLYHLENKEYDYYTHVIKDGKDNYKKVINQIENKKDSSENIEETPEYVFSKEDIEIVTDESGKKVEISKFDQTFIKVENKNKEIDYNQELSEKELKDLINQKIKSYETKKDILTKETKEQVEKKQQDLQKKQQEMDKIKEKIKKRGFKVGDYYLKYGTYKSSQEEYSISGGTYILNEDGTFVYENTWKNYAGEETTTKRTGTYEAKYSKGDMLDPKECWIIIFHTEETNEKYPQETDVYDVLENNKFIARQYPNTWTPTE